MQDGTILSGDFNVNGRHELAITPDHLSQRSTRLDFLLRPAGDFNYGDAQSLATPFTVAYPKHRVSGVVPDNFEPKLLYGRPLAREINAATWGLLKAWATLSDEVPGLAVLYLGDNADDNSYRREIARQANRVGLRVDEHAMPITADVNAVRTKIMELNADPSVSGVLVQTVRNKDLRKVAHATLLPSKDPEGVTALHTAELFYGEGEILPCTPLAILKLIKKACGNDLKGTTVCIVNSSPVIGLPLNELLVYEGCTVTLCNSSTRDLPSHTRNKDVIVAAVGATNVITSEHVTEGQVVIDAAIVRKGHNVVGCVDLFGILEKVSRVTPVPFGVGTVTTSILLDNTVRLAARALGYSVKDVERRHALYCELPS